jgi:hypothetical protein
MTIVPKDIEIYDISILIKMNKNDILIVKKALFGVQKFVSLQHSIIFAVNKIKSRWKNVSLFLTC